MEHEEHDGAQLAPITVGELLGTGARVIASNLVTFVVATTVVMSPTIIANVVYSEWVQTRAATFLSEGGATVGNYDDALSFMSTLFAGTAAVLLLQCLTWFLAQAPVVYVTVEHMAGRKASLGDALGHGLSRAVPVTVIAIISTLGATLGGMICLVPGIVVLSVLFAAVPAAVAERLGPFDAMQRSADLTLGHRVTVFVVLLVIILGYVALDWTTQQILTVGSAAGADPGDPASLLMPLPVRILSYVIHWILVVGASIPSATASAVFYARVRGIRDDVDAEEIASVFA